MLTGLTLGTAFWSSVDTVTGNLPLNIHTHIDSLNISLRVSVVYFNIKHNKRAKYLLSDKQTQQRLIHQTQFDNENTHSQ